VIKILTPGLFAFCSLLYYRAIGFDKSERWRTRRTRASQGNSEHCEAKEVQQRTLAVNDESTLNKKRVCGPPKRVHETIKKRVSGEGPRKESADQNVKEPVRPWDGMSPRQVQQETLAVDDDVDEK
jgi:hypothetical protein